MNDTKSHIVLTAFKLFLKEGYREVTMSRLVKESGLSKGAFYHYFDSKEQLFIAAVETFFFGLSEKVFIDASPDLTLRENLFRLIDSKEASFKQFAAYTQSSEPQVNFFMFIFQATQYLPQMKEKLRSFMGYEVQTLLGMIAMAEQRGELRKGIDAQLLAEQISCMLDGAELHGVMLEEFSAVFENERKQIQFLCQLVTK